jgi:hypothetical protein
MNWRRHSKPAHKLQCRARPENRIGNDIGNETSTAEPIKGSADRCQLANVEDMAQRGSMRDL